MNVFYIRLIKDTYFDEVAEGDLCESKTETMISRYCPYNINFSLPHYLFYLIRYFCIIFLWIPQVIEMDFFWFFLSRNSFRTYLAAKDEHILS